MDIGCSTFLQERQFWCHNTGQVAWIAKQHLSLIRASPEKGDLGWSLFLEVRIVCSSGKKQAPQGCPFSLPQGERSDGYNLHLREWNAVVCLHNFILCLHILCSAVQLSIWAEMSAGSQQWLAIVMCEYNISAEFEERNKHLSLSYMVLSYRIWSSKIGQHKWNQYLYFIGIKICFFFLLSHFLSEAFSR